GRKTSSARWPASAWPSRPACNGAVSRDGSRRPVSFVQGVSAVTWWNKHRDVLNLLIPGALIAVAWAARWRNGPEAAFVVPMTAAAVYAGVPIVREAWGRLQHKQFSIPLLITVASVGALWIGEVWEAAAVTFLYRFGSYLEGLTLNRTRAALRNL